MRSFEPRRPGTIVLVFVSVAAYLLAATLWGVADNFYLLRDQIRDWRFALGPLSGLPLTGTQSTAGGSSFGPIYYWLLWLIRQVVGPFTGFQPHAGAIGLTILQTTADLAFMYAVWKRWGSLWLAAAITLLVATCAHAMAIEATIWNPSVALMFVKLACAVVLIDPAVPSLWRTAGATMLAWFAVQAHTAAIFVAAPLLGAYVLRDLGASRPIAALQRLRAIVEVILLLQLPFLYHAFTSAEESAPTRALAGASEGLRIAAATHATLSFPASMLAAPWLSTVETIRVVIVICALVAATRARRDLGLLSASVLPLVCAAVGFGAWQGAYDEYWFLVFLPPVALTIAATLSAVGPERMGLGALAIVVAVQPWRLAYARSLYPMPQYGALSKGSRTIYRQAKTIRTVETSFLMPPFSDTAFVYESMGGRLDDAAEFDATIDGNGDVQFRKVIR